MMIASEFFCKKWRNGDRNAFALSAFSAIFCKDVKFFVKLLLKKLFRKESVYEDRTKHGKRNK